MGSFSNQSILTVARKMLGGATDLLLGCLVGCVTDWQQETRSLSYFPIISASLIWERRRLSAR
jgi:hypothetical protein